MSAPNVTRCADCGRWTDFDAEPSPCESHGVCDLCSPCRDCAADIADARDEADKRWLMGVEK